MAEKRERSSDMVKGDAEKAEKHPKLDENKEGDCEFVEKVCPASDFDKEENVYGKYECEHLIFVPVYHTYL